MTDEELAEMHDRAEWHVQQRDDLRLVIVSENVLALLTKVERLREERAAILAVLRDVAEYPEYARTNQAKARALLASEQADAPGRE